MASGRLAGRLRANARAFPDKKAIIYPGSDGAYRHLTYREVDERSDAHAVSLREAGIGRGTTTVLMVRPGPDLFTILFGLLKTGAVPVIADPGHGVRRMLHCYRLARAEAFVGIPVAHAVRVLNPRTFSSVRTRVTVGRRWFWGGPVLGDGLNSVEPPPEPDTLPEDLLAISFTTGSTGPAKGVEHPYGMVSGIVHQIETALGQRADDVSLVTVPLWGVFSLLLGSTCVLPPGEPAAIDPAAVADAIGRFGVTTMFASPALLDRLDVPLGSLRTVVAGGAPVRDDIMRRVCGLLGDDGASRFIVTYGATEALPISSITAAEIFAETAERTREGEGTCVGRPVPGVDVRLVRVTDEPMPVWSESLQVGPGEVGEIAVSGATVSRRYHANPEADAHTKITEGDRIWHRTGDLGHLDESGRIWFSGRKSQRVGELHTVQVEGILDAHPDVHRTALVGVAGRPVVCVEANDGADRPRVERELRALADRHEQTRRIEAFLFHPGFPVDVRHNAKINRELLAEWAGRTL